VGVLMVGDAVAEERQLHSQSRIVAMNTTYNAARSGTNSHEYVALRRTVWRCDGPRPGRGANSLSRREQLSLERGGATAVGMPTCPVSQPAPGIRAYGRGLRQGASIWHGHADISDVREFAGVRHKRQWWWGHKGRSRYRDAGCTQVLITCRGHKACRDRSGQPLQGVCQPCTPGRAPCSSGVAGRPPQTQAKVEKSTRYERPANGMQPPACAQAPHRIHGAT